MSSSGTMDEFATELASDVIIVYVHQIPNRLAVSTSGWGRWGNFSGTTGITEIDDVGRLEPN
ncbi:hypothetical protein F441_01673 [Phytophthora nicotianae CJ01A1]|uniref:Uncharacterized protein n=2 Tax=Phytophthora nicotianae TaxID=4792 RepID=W2JQY6_PHYNI|nr:hypothetical protein L915_01625 [Phytophthora nicotianae]ETL48829.1 hypothetical protein L916_01602 [Phytophthora nicotianae]ETP25444.1 hypothetical protein F441_01673 [Phytophthora nicotianae CJ01A1]